MRLSIAAHITGIKFGSCQEKQCSTAAANVKAEEAKKSRAAKRKAHDVHRIVESCFQAAAAVATPVLGKLFSPSKPLNDTPTLSVTIQS